MSEKRWLDTYPHTVYQNVLLYEGKIYNWKIGSSDMVKWRDWRVKSGDWDDFDKMRTEVNAIVCNDTKEHKEAFENIEWFKQWDIHPNHVGSPAYRQEATEATENKKAIKLLKLEIEKLERDIEDNNAKHKSTNTLLTLLQCKIEKIIKELQEEANGH